MYESPISITERLLDEYAKMVIERRDNAILAKVQSVVDVDVDKEELLRALKYDRGQYDKGYADGVRDAEPKWISVSEIERLPKEHEKVVCRGPEGGLFIAETRYCAGRVLWNDIGHIGRRKATHWMPLPEPPKEVE